MIKAFFGNIGGERQWCIDDHLLFVWVVCIEKNSLVWMGLNSTLTSSHWIE